MSKQKFDQEVYYLAITVKKPVGTKYTDQEIANLVAVKSKDRKQILVKGHAGHTPE